MTDSSNRKIDTMLGLGAFSSTNKSTTTFDQTTLSHPVMPYAETIPPTDGTKGERIVSHVRSKQYRCHSLWEEVILNVERERNNPRTFAGFNPGYAMAHEIIKLQNSGRSKRSKGLMVYPTRIFRYYQIAQSYSTPHKTTECGRREQGMIYLVTDTGN